MCGSASEWPDDFERPFGAYGTGSLLRWERALRVYRGAVAIDAEDLLRRALALPDDQRADLAAELLASLEQPVSEDLTAVRSLWNEELARRAKRVVAGDGGGEDWAAVRQRLAGELAG